MALELLRGEGEPKEAKAETTWKDGTRGEWHGVDHTLDEQFHGYRVKGSLLAREFGGRRCDVSFFFLFFRILPVMVISLSLLFWFNRLVFVLFFGFLVEPEGSRSERRCNISMEFSKRDLLCVRVFGWRINSS